MGISSGDTSCKAKSKWGTNRIKRANSVLYIILHHSELWSRTQFIHHISNTYVSAACKRTITGRAISLKPGLKCPWLISVHISFVLLTSGAVWATLPQSCPPTLGRRGSYSHRWHRTAATHRLHGGSKTWQCCETWQHKTIHGIYELNKKTPCFLCIVLTFYNPHTSHTIISMMLNILIIQNSLNIWENRTLT